MNGDYLVFESREGGRVSVRLVSKDELEREIAQRSQDGEDLNFFAASDVASMGGRRAGWDYANEGPRGMFIVPAAAAVVPKAKRTVTEWEV